MSGADDDLLVDPNEPRKTREPLRVELAAMTDRQKSLALAAHLRLVAEDVEEIMSPAAIVSALLATYLEYGIERLPAKVLVLHLRGVIERLECPPH